MIVLVANLGSTSFKYKLFDMSKSESVLASGAADRIGQGRSSWSVAVGGGASAKKAEGVNDMADHGAAIDLHLSKLVELGALKRMQDVQAIGFKAVHGGPISGAVRVDDHVLSVMEQFSDVAPQHNPPYIAAMRAFMATLPAVPQVAAFETAFHQTIPAARQVYGIPHEWTTKLGIRRYGFHGASHRYIATRAGEILPKAKRIISCHLGGSCSICAIQDGKSVANSFGMTAQSGTFHASRVGDFDTFALLKLMKSGLDLDTIFRKLGKEGGLLGLSGVSADMREVETAAAQGNAQARLALDAFVETCRHYVAAYLGVLNGADAIVFTGGIGQFGKEIRAAVLDKFDYAGIVLDAEKNKSADGRLESRIDAASGKVQVWVLPTNEELIVARQTVEVLSGRN
ncbi:MAG: acetate/propionate family kinase [Planctomycetes bacterium]|nr:acetate/propionate family kinase [Planctomycetota bacterium]